MNLQLANMLYQKKDLLEKVIIQLLFKDLNIHH